jgi:hypothetical protein
VRTKNILIPVLLCIVFICCDNKNSSGNSEATNDSLSKVHQRAQSDSLRKTNPLLIVPPDTDYTGEYVDKYPTGIIKFRGQFRFGERHGHWLSFFPNGRLWSEMHYDRGSREGANIVYNEKGKLLYSGFYKKDKKDSIWTYYDTAGTVAEKLRYKNDRVLEKLPLR